MRAFKPLIFDDDEEAMTITLIGMVAMASEGKGRVIVI